MDEILLLIVIWLFPSDNTFVKAEVREMKKNNKIFRDIFIAYLSLLISLI